MPADQAAATRHGIAVVWQDLALCDNLDVAANLMLGRERPRLLMSDTRFHTDAASLLASLRIPLPDTTRNVRSLSGGQRQLVAVARAMGRKPRLLVLDEPTASLGVKEAAQVEELIMGLREQGTTILLACHDIDQMFRLADRIVVLRQGRMVGDLRTADAHPDDVVALISGQQVDSSARRQLTRLHGLADRLVSADPSSSLSLILSALGAALGSERLCIHLVTTDPVLRRLARLQARAARPLGQAAVRPRRRPGRPGRGRRAPGHRRHRPCGAGWGSFRDLAKTAKVASSWSVPVLGPSGLSGVITVFRAEPGAPEGDELDLVTVYAGYAASAIERDRLLDEVTTSNRVLETIREMLETLAGPVPVGEGLAIAVQALRRGLQAHEVALFTQPAGQPARWRAFAGPLGTDWVSATPPMREIAETALASRSPTGWPGSCRAAAGTACGRWRSWRPAAPRCCWPAGGGCRRPRRRRRCWRTPPTRCGWPSSVRRPVRPIRRRPPCAGPGTAARVPVPAEPRAAHAADRHQGLRLQPDAARRDLGPRLPAALPGPDRRRVRPPRPPGRRPARLLRDRIGHHAPAAGLVRHPAGPRGRDRLPAAGQRRVGELSCDPSLPVVWADHDRLEQVFVNLLDNAFGHNPPGTRVRVTAGHRASEVVISVRDDGIGMPAELGPPRSRPPAACARATMPGAPRNARHRPPQDRRRRPRPVHRQGDRGGPRRPDRADPAARGHLLPGLPADRGRGRRGRLAASMSGASESDGPAGDGPAASGRDRDRDDD